jgi:hypothetical protein
MTEMKWADAEPGYYPVFLVGAGFSLAVMPRNSIRPSSMP